MKKRPEKQTWEAPAATAQIIVRALSKTSVRVENLGDGVKTVDGKGRDKDRPE
jgi:hypothetical protein